MRFLKKRYTSGLKAALTIAMSLMLATSFSAGSYAVDTIESISGPDRYTTAGNIASNMTYQTAILVNSDKSLADGLSASGLAGVVNAPILLVKKNKIPTETELRLGTTNRVYIIGSTNSVGKNIENMLRKGGIDVIRIGGSDRLETSYNVAREILRIKGAVGKMFVANAYKGEADAMSLSSVTARDGEPIILTNGKTISREARELLKGTRNTYVIGGASTMSENIVMQLGAQRIGGVSRYNTNELIIRTFYPSATSFFIADGHKLVDALTGGPLGANEGKAIVLVSANNPNENILKGAVSITALGGVSDVIKDAVIRASN